MSEKSKDKTVSSSACWADWHADLTLTIQLHTHTRCTDQPSTPPPNAPALTYPDHCQSQHRSYALTLCSFPWPHSCRGEGINCMSNLRDANNKCSRRVTYRDEGFLVGLSEDFVSRLILKLMRLPPAPDEVTESGWLFEEWLCTFFFGISSQIFSSFFFLLGVVTDSGPFPLTGTCSDRCGVEEDSPEIFISAFNV